MAKVDSWFDALRKAGGSDLHLSVGLPPSFRVHGHLQPIRKDPLTGPEFETLIREITPPPLWKEYVETGDVDFAYEVPGLARFRTNLLSQHRGSGAVFRIIPTRIQTMEELGLPKQLYQFTRIDRGLVLVTGPTGSGKSTTLAAIINEINATRNAHIITIEDPIEFVHENQRSLITQREIGEHTQSFAQALRAAVREDPNVVLVGEMRDLETINLALTSAEMGLLVFGTLHTNSAPKTVDRIIDAFPAEEQEQVRMMLSESLVGVVAQQLLRRSDKPGRVAALEILIGSPALANLIREGKTHQIGSHMQTGRGAGMVTMDRALLELVEKKMIDPRDAAELASDRAVFAKFIKKDVDMPTSLIGGSGWDADTHIPAP
jgi:twitching motility protein PilT